MAVVAAVISAISAAYSASEQHQVRKDVETQIANEAAEAERLKQEAITSEEEATTLAEKERKDRLKSLAEQGRQSTFSPLASASASKPGTKTLLGS